MAQQAEPVELRVHGVSGTPPAAMLELAPVLDDLRGVGKAATAPEVAVWRAPQAREKLRAFDWGSLTSGRPSQALWLLLVPYVFANVAGWSAVPLIGWRQRVVALCARVGGLAVTASFGLACYLVLADVLAAQGLVGERGWPAITVALGAVLAALLVLVLFRATRVRLREENRDLKPWEHEGDPLGRAWLHHDPQRLWNSPGTIVRLRAMHLAMGLGAIAAVAAAARPGLMGATAAGDVAALVLAGLALLVPVVALVLFTTGGSERADAPLMRPLARWVGPVVALAAMVVAVVRLAGVPAEVIAGAVWLPAIRGAGGWVAVVTLLAAVVGFVVQLTGGALPGEPRATWRQSMVLPAFVLLAGAVGGGLGSGLALQTARLLGAGSCERGVMGAMAPPPCPVEVGPNVEWLAIAFTWIATLVVWVMLVGALRALRRVGPVVGRPMAAVADLTTGASWLFALLGSVGIVTVAGGLVLAWRGDGLPDPNSLPQLVGQLSLGALLVPVTAMLLFVAARAAWRLPTGLLKLTGVLALAGAVVALIVALGRGWSVEVLGVVLPPRTFLDAAQLVALTLPIAAMVHVGLYQGLRSRDVRRGVGVLWDLGGSGRAGSTPSRRPRTPIGRSRASRSRSTRARRPVRCCSRPTARAR